MDRRCPFGVCAVLPTRDRTVTYLVETADGFSIEEGRVLLAFDKASLLAQQQPAAAEEPPVPILAVSFLRRFSRAVSVAVFSVTMGCTASAQFEIRSSPETPSF